MTARRPCGQEARTNDGSVRVADAPMVRGKGAARGIYVGVARVLSDASQLDEIRPGDVLVCQAATPALSFLLARIGALVSDAGGILSNPAILAREHGIAAVVATGNATQVIRDGQRVAVDGERGVVRFLP